MIIAAISFTEIWPIIATIVGIASSICSAAIWFAMGSLKDSIRAVSDKQAKVELDIIAMRDRQSSCRQECDDKHASKEDVNREAGYSRRFQERQIADMAEIKTLVSKMPQMTGHVIREVLAEIKRGSNGN